jgi:hypothetical protein
VPDNTTAIKEGIHRAYKNGKCDIDGHSVRGASGMTAKPRSMVSSAAIIYRYKDGKMQRVN